MSTSAICRYSCILIFSLLLVSGSAGHVWAQADTTSTADTTAEDAPAKKVQAGSKQLCLGVDIFHPILNSAIANKYSYEFEAHYYLKNEFFAVAEGGWGGSRVDYTDLQYSTTNTFVRLGFNKSILARDAPNDWDMMFIGVRLGYTTISRTEASYTVVDSVWGNSLGASPAKIFPAYWAELTGGMRVELVKGLMAGWNIRGKFMLNGRSFKDLAPLNIAGYGKGDKNANFDFNVYVSYAIRWKGKPQPVKQPAKKDK